MTPISDPESSDSAPVMREIYAQFRELMPGLPEDYREGLADWRLLRTTQNVHVTGYASTGVTADLTFINGLEYHGEIHVTGADDD